MSFRTKIMLCTAVLIALAFGLGGTLLISLSFQNALDQQEERAVQSFQTVQSTLGLVNSVSSQTQEEDVVSVLRHMDTQSGGAWLASLRRGRCSIRAPERRPACCTACGRR